MAPSLALSPTSPPPGGSLTVYAKKKLVFVDTYAKLRNTRLKG
jgi:hypothetical protein